VPSPALPAACAADAAAPRALGAASPPAVDPLSPPAVDPASLPAAMPTLADVALLNAESDYAAFTAPGVDERVRNEALRKLFHSDPHFRRSDGLDVAVDEVVELAQSPLARQQKIRQARAMGLLDDDLLDQQEPDADPPPA
jgi:hypothetical protein